MSLFLFLALLGSLGWVLYHKGIEEGRRRQRRDNGEPMASVTKIWERKR